MSCSGLHSATGRWRRAEVSGARVCHHGIGCAAVQFLGWLYWEAVSACDALRHRVARLYRKTTILCAFWDPLSFW